MADWIERLPHWTWSFGSAHHSTSILPELVAGAAMLGLALVLLAAHRREQLAGSTTRGLVIVSAMLAAMCTAISVAFVSHFERLDLGLLPWTLTLVAVGVGAPVALARASRGLSARYALAALLLLPLTQLGALHAAWITVTDWPEIGVEGSAHQHVGLSQHVRGTLREGGHGWRLTRRGGFVSGEREGTTTIVLEARRGTERVRREVRVRVGQEIGDARFPLASGASWTYLVTEVGSRSAPARQSIEVEQRQPQGPLRVVHLSGLGRAADVYAIDGALYVYRTDGVVEPFFGPAADGGFVVERMGLRCRAFAPPGEEVELGGPSPCERAAPHGLAVMMGGFASLLSLGTVPAPSRFPLEATLIRSRRDASAAWEIPTASEG